MDESSIDESIFTSESGGGRHSPAPTKSNTLKVQQQKQQPTPPATIALPVKPRDEDESVEDYSNHVQPFDEPHVDDDVPSDVSCGVDEPQHAAPAGQSLLVAAPRMPSDEINAEQQPLMEISIPSPAKTPKQQNNSSKSMKGAKSATKTPVGAKDVATKSTTPETQASPGSPEQGGGIMEAYSHGGLENDEVSTRLFDGDDTAAFLEEGKGSSYQKPIANSEDNEKLSDEDDSKADSTARRKSRRCFLFCFLFSLLMIAAATGVSVYMFVFKSGSRKTQAVVGPPTLAPSASPSSEPTAPTSSPAPSLAPSLSAIPSDLPSGMPSFSPSDFPSASPSDAPSDAPSTSPTMAPTRDFSTVLTEFMFGTYGVTFDDPVMDMAVEWLNLESQRLVGSGQMEMTQKVAQRFALLALEFSAMDLAPPQEEVLPANVQEALDEVDVNITYSDLNTSVATAGEEEEGSGFFGGAAVARQSNIPITMDSQFLVPECNWTGIECDEEGYVTTVKWPYRDYRGQIPKEIRILANLTHLDLSNNYLAGKIPEEVYYLTNLEKLYLFKNFFTGTISTRIGDLDSITHFHLSHNELTGSIPTELKSDNSGIRPLKYFNVYSNKLTGTIPENLRLRRIKYFDLGRNQLTGRLPRDLGEQFVELRQLHLDHNDFRGELPRSYNTVGNGRLTSFTINNNRLTGYVTGDRDLYNNLLEYTLHENRFSGLDRENCRMEIPYGEMVEFKADCDICRCNGWFNLCDRWCD